ncbi:hypothetical protein AeNC1_011362, partial [Aphanomyces euteiches]
TARRHRATEPMVRGIEYVVCPQFGHDGTYQSTSVLAWVARIRVPKWNSFQEYTNVMSAFFESVFHNKTSSESSDDVITLFDASSNTFAMRYIVDIPYSIPHDQVQDYLLLLPGITSFGTGMELYLTTFLTSNTSSRAATKPWHICEHEIEQVDSFDESSPRYNVWAAIYSLETPQLCWFKFIFRWLVAIYVLHVLWTRYYTHCRVLLSNLRCVGLGPEIVHYRVIFGDPAYVILTDPIVSVAIFVDIWYSMPYTIAAGMRVSQFSDLWSYALGCMYLSRTVWFAYLGMRGLSSFIKWRRWESSFAPVDPTFLALISYISGGPMTSFITKTPAAWAFRRTLTVLLTESEKEEAVEGILGVLIYTVMMPRIQLSTPEWLSCGGITAMVRNSRSDYSDVFVGRRVKLGVQSTNEKTFSHPFYNDIKAVVLFSLVMRQQSPSCLSIGGSLHSLYHKNSRYRSLPLFSHRAADVFVVCYNADGRAVKQVRLSLSSWLDRQSRNPKLEFPMCPAVHSTSVSHINDVPCPTMKLLSTHAHYLHVGDSNCPWVM